jgi:hypothetical protein
MTEPDDQSRTDIASKGGRARADALSSVERREIARKAAEARWAPVELGEDEVLEPLPSMPVARWRGPLNIIGMEVPCYVLDNGVRVIGRTSATELLTNIKGGGALEKYLGVRALEPFINIDLLLERMVPFRIPEVEGLEKAVKGLPADLIIEICQSLIRALEANLGPNPPEHHMTARQQQMAVKASMFLSACAKVGLDALIDEATGYQFERSADALQVKLAAYLEDEMRKWEKTFPDELWKEFGRLTGWQGSIYQRPKYWGRLVMELIYEKLDSDVAQWLKENAPTPRHGQNYHQWLSGQYGLKKLVEHIWMVVGVAKTCETMIELRDRVAALDGKQPIQLRLYLPSPKNEEKIKRRMKGLTRPPTEAV